MDNSPALHKIFGLKLRQNLVVKGVAKVNFETVPLNFPNL